MIIPDQNKTDTAEPQWTEENFRSKRLLQIYWVTQLVLLVALAQLIWMGNWLQAGLITCTILVITSVSKFAKQNQSDIGGNILILTATAIVMLLAWSSLGLRDEVLLAYPAIISFSIFFGSRGLTKFLLLFAIINIIAIGAVNDYGIYIHETPPSSLDAAFIIVIIFCIFTYSISLSAKDMRTALDKLSQENLRVKESQHQIKTMVYHDALTGLPNRLLVRDRFHQAFSASKRNKTNLHLMFIDLDDFKHINDSLGHEVGDLYLKHIADLLSSSVRASDTVCRLGGDEFLLLLENLDTRDAAALAQKVIDYLRQPADIGDNQIITTCSIGIAAAPADDTDFDALCSKADIAMYQGKESGKNSFRFFDSQMNQNTLEAIELIADLRQAIDRQEMQLYYQPQINLNTNQINSAEALIRWQHPKYGMIPPDKFIPLAERSGVIIELGEWILREACRQCAHWKDYNLPNFKIAINVSPMQLRRENFFDTVTQALADNKIESNNIELEFTESLLMEAAEDVTSSLNKLKNAKVHLSIDDFGTGYSNLSYLTKFDIETLKIDRSFISRIEHSEKDYAVVKAIIQMASSLGINIVAEGVEELASLNLLQELKCSIGQGYYWSKALPAEEFLAFVNNHNATKVK